MGAALDLLHHLRGAGLVLTLTPAGGLHVAPRAALTDDHRAAIRAGRDALVLALRAQAEQAPATCSTPTTTSMAMPTAAPTTCSMPSTTPTSTATSTAITMPSTMTLALDADRWCWPHSAAMNGAELDTFTARLARFTLDPAVGRARAARHQA